MSDLTKKQLADAIRVEILTMSDDDLINFKNSVISGEDAKGEAFESVSHMIKRVSDNYLKTMPF